MAYNTFGPGLALDKVTMRGLPVQPAKITDAETGDLVQAYTLGDTPDPIIVTTNAYGYFPQFQATDDHRRIVITFGGASLDQTASEIPIEAYDAALAAQAAAVAAQQAAEAAQQAAEAAAALVSAPPDSAIAAAVQGASTLTRAALDGLYGTLVTTTTKGQMSAADKVKLDGIPAGGGGGGGPLKTIREVLVGEDINAALTGYEGEVRLQRGTHNTAVPIIQNRRQKVVGEGGGATIVRATAAIAGGLWRIGNGAPCDKTHLSDMTIDANGLAAYGLDMNIVGTTGNYGGEPDGQVHVERLYIDGATDIGVYTRGGDTQAYHLYGIRVRRAGNYGFRVDVGGPDAWILDCEATTSITGTGAGFLIGSSNLHFKGCKAWYCRGYGWDIKGTRNIFVDCESQDTRLHGWYIEWDKNIFVGCMADSAGYADVGGVSNTQDGFYLAGGMTMTGMSGCVAFDREQGFPANMRYGFNMSASTYNIGRSTVATTAPTGTGTTPVMIGSLSGGTPGTPNYKTLGGLLNLR